MFRKLAAIGIICVILILSVVTAGCRTSATSTTTTQPAVTTPTTTASTITTTTTTVPVPPTAPTTNPPPVPPVTVISLSKDVQPIFNASCVGCHSGANPSGLNIAAASAFGNLVNVKSSQSPLMRVAPRDPDKSYLIIKLKGTQAQAGGSGERMPLNKPALSDAQIETISRWISIGAPQN